MNAYMEAELEALSEMWWDELFARTPETFWDKVEADIKAEQERGELLPLDEWLDNETQPLDVEKLNKLLRTAE